MKKLLDILGLRKTEGDFGIEIEVEGDRLPAVDGGGWKTEVDHSLRGGLEYIFKQPCFLPEVKTRLEYLKEEFTKAEASPKFSFRTSVHVHLNAQGLTYNQILNTIYTYLLVEEPLMNLCGENRKGNRFCLRLADAEGMLNTLSKLFEGNEAGFHRNIPPNKMRYAAINIESLTKYGSLEFRAMQGNVDTEKIVLWCTSLKNIRDFSRKFKNPTEVYNEYVKESPDKFFQSALGECAAAFDYPELVHDIQKNFSLTIDLPFSFAKKKEEKEEKALATGFPQFKKMINPIIAPDRQMAREVNKILNRKYMEWIDDRAARGLPPVTWKQGTDWVKEERIKENEKWIRNNAQLVAPPFAIADGIGQF